MLLNPCTIHVPKSLAELTQLHAELKNVRLQAGGTFLLNALKLLKKNGAKTPEHIISLNKINELKGIEETSEGLLIKSMTSIDTLFNAKLKDNYAILKTVCQNISTQPIRNMATVGGNLTCRYTWTEMPAVMVGLQATLYFTAQGKEEALSALEFYQQGAKTDKILTHIVIPHQPQASMVYQRVKKTQYVDIPLLSLLISTVIKSNQLSETIVSLNNCVDFAQRDTKLEEFLNGKEINDSIIDEALNNLTHELYDRRANDYKKHMFRLSIKKALQEIQGTS